MIKVIYSPQWFYGKDIAIDIISIFVLLLIAVTAIRFYKLKSTKKNYLLLATSFFLLAVSFVFKILTNFTLYYHVIEQERIGSLTFSIQEMEPSKILFFVGFLLYRLLTLIGLYILYSIHQEKQPKTNIVIIVLLLIITTYFSRSAYYIFHFISLVLLVSIVSQYIKNYRKTKNPVTKMIAYSFGIITLSNMFSLFIGASQMLYVSAASVQLIGYILLLIAFLKALHDGKKA